MKKFSEFINEAKLKFTEDDADNTMSAKYKGGWLSVICAKNSFRYDIQDKDGNVKTMGDEYNNVDDFTNALADNFDIDWRTNGAKLLEFIEGFAK